MLGIVRPSIPLNPPDGAALVLDNKNMSRLNAVDARPIFLFKAHEIEWFVPPRIDMRLGKPPLQQWKVGPFKGAERDQVYRPAEYQKSIAGIHRPGTLKVRPLPRVRDWYVQNPGIKVELAERQTARKMRRAFRGKASRTTPTKVLLSRLFGRISPTPTGTLPACGMGFDI